MLTCPGCLETAEAPIYTCPECRERYRGAPKVHRYAEMDAEELKKMKEELARITA